MKVFGAQRAGEAAKAGARHEKASARQVKVGRAHLVLPSKQRSKPDTDHGRLACGAASLAIPAPATDDERHGGLRVCGWGLAPSRSPFIAAYTSELVIPSFETRPPGAPQDEGLLSIWANKTFILRSRGLWVAASRRMG